VGGLLKAIIKGNKQLPPPDAAIFVVNKWDILCQQQNAEEQEEFLNKTRKEIATRWPGFKERQLITMNARLAASLSEKGGTTDDLQKLYDAITRVLPIGMDYMVVRALKYVYHSKPFCVQ
jgi:predicted GTPase